jgi:hypothetical protein
LLRQEGSTTTSNDKVRRVDHTPYHNDPDEDIGDPRRRLSTSRRISQEKRELAPVERPDTPHDSLTASALPALNTLGYSRQTWEVQYLSRRPLKRKSTLVF